MGLNFLFDSNAVIDFLNQRLPETARNFLYECIPILSIVTRIEIFSKPALSKEEQLKLMGFLSLSKIYLISEEVALETIEVRIKYRLKFPDAVIAATAIVTNIPLITNNFRDFEKVEGLLLINPYTF